MGHCGRNDDHFVELQPLFNFERGNIPSVTEIRAEKDSETARIHVSGSLAGLRFDNTYAVALSEPRVLRVSTTVTREAAGPDLRLFGDVILHGNGSLQAFTVHTARPDRTPGFDHPGVDPDRPASRFAAIRDADFQILVGGPTPAPGIAYGVRLESARLESEDGSSEDVAPLAVNGDDFSLLGVFANPFWVGGDGIGVVELLQTLFMDLDANERLVVERSVRLGSRSDVASVLDAIHAAAPEVRGRVDDTTARLHVDRADGTPFSHVRPEPDGRFAFRALAGSYELRLRTPDGRLARRTFSVAEDDLDLGDLSLGSPGRVALPRGTPMRLVFVGVEGTPDPRIGDDGIDLRFGNREVRASVESNDLALAGLQDDPVHLALPPGRYRVLATRGPEFTLGAARIEVRAGETTPLAIAPPARAVSTPGWIAADLHVHAAPSDDSTLPLRAQLGAFLAHGGEVLVATDHDRVTDYAPLIGQLGVGDRLASVVGSEVTSSAVGEATPFTSGHYNVFPLSRDPDAYRDGTPFHEGRRLRDVIADVRALGGTRLVQLNHARDATGDLVRLAYLSHLAVPGSPFVPGEALDSPPNRILVEPDPKTGLRDLDFDVMELLNGPTMAEYPMLRADWFALLLQGEFRAGTANSDSHSAWRNVALPRTYVRVADDAPAAFDRDAFVEAVRAGHSYGTTGPIVDARLGDAGPGDLVAKSMGELRVAVQAAPWVPLERARVYVNGREVHAREITADDELRVSLSFDGDSFVTVEVDGPAEGDYAAVAPGSRPFAFTNPIFVDADGDGRWVAPGLPKELPDTITRPSEL